jgi:hypothetical protein
MSDTASFMDSLTERQRDVFGLIAIGVDVGHNPRTLVALAKRGLIVGHRETLPGHPPVRVVRWEVPLPVHIEWAQWCSEQPDSEE